MIHFIPVPPKSVLYLTASSGILMALTSVELGLVPGDLTLSIRGRAVSVDMPILKGITDLTESEEGLRTISPDLLRKYYIILATGGTAYQPDAISLIWNYVLRTMQEAAGREVETEFEFLTLHTQTLALYGECLVAIQKRIHEWGGAIDLAAASLCADMKLPLADLKRLVEQYTQR